MRINRRALAAIPAVAALSLAAACSSSTSSSTSTAPASSAPAATSAAASSAPASSAAPALSGSLAFNQGNLAKLDAALAAALKGKPLSAVNIAMVVNVAADYWKAGQVGFLAGCKALGLPSNKCTYFAPPNGKLTEQTSELETLRSQGITGYSISAIDPASAKGTIATDMGKGVFVLPIDSPLPGTAAAGLYLGTPNTEAGFQAGTAMKQLLNGTGKVAILVGSLTAANATQRIAGFEQAIAGTQHHRRPEGQRQPVARPPRSRTRRPSWPTTRTSTACTASTPTTARRSPRPCSRRTRSARSPSCPTTPTRRPSPSSTPA